MMPRYVITGGLGTGKTSVLAVLRHQFETIAEPARELIAEHRAATGKPGLISDHVSYGHDAWSFDREDA